MRTAQSGLFWSVWVNAVLCHAKQLGERSFSLVMMSLMYLDGFHVKTSKNASAYMRMAQTGLYQGVWVNSVLFHAKQLRERSFSLVMLSAPFYLLWWVGCTWMIPMRKHSRMHWFTCERRTPGCFGAFGLIQCYFVQDGSGSALFTCYDEFDLLGLFSCENIQECVRLHANGAN